MKTAVVYARYSSDRQTEQSIEGQLHVCQKFAENNDIVIVDTYIDRAMTGTNDNRDAFQKMLKDSDKKAWNYVLVYKLDRFSRNKYEMAIHRKHLKDNSVKILSAMENIPDTPEGTLLESLLEGMNQYYSEELSQKTKRGLNETRRKGNFPCGHVLYGYKVVNHKVQINDEEAAILNQIFFDYASGKRLKDIILDLNEKGILRRNKPFKTNNIYYALQNEKYIGRYSIHGVDYDNIFPAIIPEDIFERVRQRINANKYGKHVIGVDYLLKGIAYCGCCGKPLTSYSGTSKNGEIYRYYKCYSTKKQTGCTTGSIRKENLEGFVTDALLNALSTKENMALLVDDIMRLQQEKNSQNAELRIMEKQLASVSKSLTNILNAIEAGIYTETTRQRLIELEAQKKELEQQIAIQKAKSTIMLKREDIEKYISSALKQNEKTLIQMLVERIDVTKEYIIITFKYTPVRNDKNPEGDKSDRGSLFVTYEFSYEQRTKCDVLINYVNVSIYLR